MILNRILKFLWQNKEWLFSGIGIIVLSILYKFFSKKKAKENSTIINFNSGISITEVKEIAESVFYKNFPKLIELAKIEADKNKDLFVQELVKTLESNLDSKEYIAFKNPDIQYMLLESLVIASRNNSLKKREILSNLLVNRIKCNNYELGEVIYNDAIKSISFLTNTQIKILSFIEITSSLIFLIIDEEFLIEDDLVLSFLNKPVNITPNDIEHLKNCRLISSTFPYEIDETKILNCRNIKFQKLTNKCKEFTDKYKSFGLNQLQTTLTGKAIAQTNISSIIKTEINNLKRGPLKLSDFRARNITAEGEITAFST